jgi:hypothetical protein
LPLVARFEEQGSGLGDDLLIFHDRAHPAFEHVVVLVLTAAVQRRYEAAETARARLVA